MSKATLTRPSSLVDNLDEANTLGGLSEAGGHLKQTGILGEGNSTYLVNTSDRVNNETRVAGPSDERNGYSVHCVQD